MTAGLLAAQPGGWTGAPSGDGGAAVPDAWLLLSDAAFAGLLPGYAFAQSVTQTLSLTAADNIGDGGTLELDGPRGIAVFESDGSTYAAVTVHDDNRVQILNVTDPSNVTAAGSIAHGGAINLDDPYGIATFTSGSSTYAAVAASTGDGVQILDITDPSAITAAGNITNTDDLELDGAWDIATFTSGSSTYAAVAAFRDDGVQILDITDPSNVTETDSIAHGGAINLDGAWDIATFTSGNSTYAAVTASMGDGGVQILDITDPSAITAAGNITDTPSLELDGANGIAVFESGDSTYAAVAAYNDNGVQILDITDPSAITAAGNITDTPALELLGASGIAVFESGGSTYAAVAAYDDDSVQILDITDPSAITAAGNITDTGSPRAVRRREHRHVHIRRQHLRSSRRIRRRRRPDPAPDRSAAGRVCHHVGDDRRQPGHNHSGHRHVLHRLGGRDGERDCLGHADAQLRFCRQPHRRHHRRAGEHQHKQPPLPGREGQAPVHRPVGEHSLDHDGRRVPRCIQHGIRRRRYAGPLRGRLHEHHVP